MQEHVQETNPAAQRLISHVLGDYLDENGQLKYKMDECCCMPDCEPPPVCYYCAYCEIDIIY